jgi:hypothetical protein
MRHAHRKKGGGQGIIEMITLDRIASGRVQTAPWWCAALAHAPVAPGSPKMRGLVAACRDRKDSSRSKVERSVAN